MSTVTFASRSRIESCRCDFGGVRANARTYDHPWIGTQETSVRFRVRVRVNVSVRIRVRLLFLWGYCSGRYCPGAAFVRESILVQLKITQNCQA